MKRRILKKFVKAYHPYGTDREGILLGMKEEGHGKYWHHGGNVRWWTHERYKQRKYKRKHPNITFWMICRT